jgi:YidC/Oxa1 family membrane protein insertase
MVVVDADLGKSVDLGWFGFFGRPVFWLLNLFHTYTGSWGISIVLLTFVIKTLFFPLTASAFRSGLKMQAIQPRIAALKEELKDNPEELNRRTMALFSQHGVNPVGGCLPSLAQVPVWMALGNVLYYSVELYHSRFLYLKDLSSLDPYGVLPVLVVSLQLLLQRMMPTANMDPSQARMMQWMPVVLAFLYFSFPSGLMVYIFCNLLLTIVQQAIMKRVYHPPVLPA